jgi:hypothetical protein
VRFDGDPTAIAGNVIAIVGIQLQVDATVDADQVGDPFVLSLGVGLVGLGTGQGVPEGTAAEGLLHHTPSASASRIWASNARPNCPWSVPVSA